MRISQIETIPLEIPLRTPFTTAKAQQTKARLILIKLHTDTGILGVGECDPRPHITGETMKSALSAIRDYLSPALVGMELSEAKDLAKICARMDEVLIANPSAKDGIDIAAHDALGKKKRFAVCEQPNVWDDMTGLAEITSSVDGAVMANEAVWSPYDASILVRLKATDFVNIKHLKSGGLHYALEIAKTLDSAAPSRTT